MATPIIAQTIAKDQSEVESKLQGLMNTWNIDQGSIIDFEVIPFGANQFLIVVAYYGLYTLWAWLGLVSSIARAINMNRALSATKGLASAVGRVVDFTRAGSAPVGLVSGIARACTFERALSTAIGLISAAYQWSWDEKISPAGLSVSFGYQVDYARGLSPAAGLVCDIGYVYTHP